MLQRGKRRIDLLQPGSPAAQLIDLQLLSEVHVSALCHACPHGGCTLAVHNAAPTPVVTQQPIRAACPKGMSGSMRTRLPSGTTPYSANDETAAKCLIS